MSLRSKIVLILSAVVLVYAGLDHLIQRALVLDSFVKLESAGADRDLQRVVHAINSEIERLDSDCTAWANADEMYRFAVDGNPALLPQAFESKGVHLLCVCDRGGKVIWSRIHSGSGSEDVKLDSFPRDALPSTHPLLLARENVSGLAGLWTTERGPMIVSSRPIVGGVNGGAARGTLIAGRWIDAAMQRVLAERTEVSIDLWSVDDPTLPADARAVVVEAAGSPGTIVREVDEDHLHAYSVCASIHGAPALVVRGNLDRDVIARGTSAVRYGFFSTIAAGILLMVVLLKMLERTVLQPIAQLTRYAVDIGRTEDFSRRIASNREDEVGVLAREFDGMIEKVAQSRTALVKAARAAGMSEIATGVLHNVGNVLNSVNVSAALVGDKVRATSAADLKNVMDTLRPASQDLVAFLQRDPRGKHLFPLLDSISQQILDEQESIVREVRSLNDGICHVKELIQAQQCHAGRAGVLETVSIAEQLEAAMTITGQAVDDTIEIEREYEDIPPTPVDRHRLLEILVNVIQNARQSVHEAGVVPARVTLGITRSGADRVRIAIGDNGVGIPRENLARVFGHGFTTKQTGHGFGLHASANAATEMGGKLTAESNGQGFGATFVLEIPLSRVPATGVTT